jgi:uncharacterized protein YkwD
MNLHNLTWRSTVIAAAMLLAACGGGGGDPASPATPSAAGPSCGLGDFTAIALVRVNQLRAAGADCRSGGTFAPAAALAWNALLTQASEAHSQDMVAKNFFAHTGSNGSLLSARVNATGYAWTRVGENIAAGYPSLDSVLSGWMASDDHCANLMHPDFNQIGLVCVAGTAATTYNNYWTMDLAQAR